MNPNTVRHIVAAALFSLLLVGRPGQALGQTGPARIVISQIYASGAEETSTYKADFVEIFNQGGEAISLDGWTLEYAPASTGIWSPVEVLGWTIEPGQYNLLMFHTTAYGALSLPLHDSLAFNDLETEGGQVRLIDLFGNVSDLVGYGTALGAEGQPAPAASRVTALHRIGNGCQDSENNLADFRIAAPYPRNQSFRVTDCAIWLDGASRDWPRIESVIDGASNLSGPLVPGQILTIRGMSIGPDEQVVAEVVGGRYLPVSVAGTQVIFDKGSHQELDDTPAPILSASRQQVSIVVPQWVSKWDEVSVRVNYLDRKSERRKFPVAEAAPALFTSNLTGRGQAVALNQNATPNSLGNPAAKGSLVTLYLTGAGRTDPPLPDGMFVGKEQAHPVHEVTVTVGGQPAEVLSAAPAYGMVNGVLAVNLRIPAGLNSSGPVPVKVTAGGAVSQDGVTLSIAGESAYAPSGDIESRLGTLTTDPAVPALAELPNDRAGLPDDWLGLISWNVNAAAGPLGDPRALMLETALRSIYSGTYDLVAAQGVPDTAQHQRIRTALPGGAGLWGSLFFDTTSALDNAIWHRPTSVKTSGGFALGIPPKSQYGRLLHDPNQAVHPPVVGHYLAGNFDFTLISVHHFYTNGETERAAAEFTRILDYLAWYFNQPGHDPDVLICGDFGIPSALSGETAGGITLDGLLEADARFSDGDRRFVVLGHEKTERQTHGEAVRNTDHCLCSIDTLEELIQVKRISPALLTDHPADPALWLTSDHFPLAAFFRTQGDGVQRDGSQLIPAP